MSVKEKATAPVSSVGADGKQPLCKANKESIADLPDKGNLQATNNRGCGTEVWTEKRDRIDGLETVSMTELYDTVYPPKIQNSALPHRIIPQIKPHAYMVAELCHKEGFSYLWCTHK